MAIKKKVTADNGIVTEYHRILMVRIEVNQQNTILVHSYLSADGRQIEKDYADGVYTGEDAETVKFPYVAAAYVHTAYDANMTVKAAYEYLKTLPQFEGAEDV